MALKALPVQVAVAGDELVAGHGDTRAMGWLGRVAAQANPVAGAVFYPLAVPGESTRDLAERWETEVARRFTPEHGHLLVLAPGIGDLQAGITLARSRLNIAGILDTALAAGYHLAVVGPPPGPWTFNGQIEALSMALEEVSTRRGVPFVDCYATLRNHQQFQADLHGGDGHHPSHIGYGLLAWLVMHAGFNGWLARAAGP